MTLTNIAVFENQSPLFHPMTLARCAYELITGCFSLLDRIQYYFPNSLITLYCAPHLTEIMKHRYPSMPVNWLGNTHHCLFLNSQLIIDQCFVDTLTAYNTAHAYLVMSPDGMILAIHATPALAVTIHDQLTTGKPGERHDALRALCQSQCAVYHYTGGQLITTAWDCLMNHHTQLQADMQLLNRHFGIIKSDSDVLSVIKHDDDVFIDAGAHIDPFVMIDATTGPIYIEKNVVIRSHTRLEGPLYIGRNTTILGGVITASRIGKYCKIRGDVSQSIIHDYTNKAHDGFIGNSYIGDWVNLGALTTGANLKTTYGFVRPVLPAYSATQRYTTTSQFLGSCIGDHVRTACGTVLNAGTSVGYGTTLLGATSHSGFIPPFSWGMAPDYERQRLHDFIMSVTRMMARRRLVFRATDKKLVAVLFEQYRDR